MTERIESELKFWAADDGPLQALAVAPSLGPAQLGAARVVDELDCYLDTAELRLAARRWACRLRTREGRTIVSLKGPAEHLAGATMHRRPELEGSATSDADAATWPLSAARTRLLEMAGGQPLVERLAMAQQRTEREVRQGSDRIGVLSLDRVRVLLRDEEVGRLTFVELEFDPLALAAGCDPRPLESALEMMGGLRPDPRTKLEHAIEITTAAQR